MSYTNATYDILDIIFVVSIDIDDDGRFDFEAEKWNKWKKRMGRREEGREGSCLLCLHCEVWYRNCCDCKAHVSIHSCQRQYFGKVERKVVGGVTSISYTSFAECIRFRKKGKC